MNNTFGSINDLNVSKRDWFAFTLSFTLNGYTAKAYPLKWIQQVDNKPYGIELCWTVDKNEP